MVSSSLVNNQLVLQVDHVSLPAVIHVLSQALAQSGLQGAEDLLLASDLQDLLGLPAEMTIPSSQIEQTGLQRRVVEVSC